MFSAVAGLPMAARPVVDDFVSKSSLFALICRIYPDQAGSSLDSYLSGLACVLKSIEYTSSIIVISQVLQSGPAGTSPSDGI